MTDGRLRPQQIERFERLAWPLLPDLLRTARLLTGRDADAEDLVQETMIKAMRFIDRYRDGTDIRAWLLTILRRTQIDRARAEARRPTEVGLDDAPQTEAQPEPGHLDEQWREPEELLARFEDRAVIDAMRRLPPDIRWTLLLTDVQQMDHADAAGVLEVPVGTIKSRVHRGRRMLRDHLMTVAQQRGWARAPERTP